MGQFNKPTHAIFFIKTIPSTSTSEESGKQKSKWTRIGAAWELESGRINTVFDMAPVCPGTIQLVPIELLEDNNK